MTLDDIYSEIFIHWILSLPNQLPNGFVIDKQLGAIKRGKKIIYIFQLTDFKVPFSELLTRAESNYAKLF